MTDRNSQGPTMLVGGNKIAMSRALGAAFLSHQVEQLERSTTREGRGDSANNWRERESPDRRTAPTARNAGANDTQQTPGGSPPRGTRRRVFDSRQPAGPNVDTRSRRRPGDGPRRDKYADIIIVDASVLVHCISQIKAWCRDGREEVLIVPLEALNTLDLLKKGTSVLAQRARTASRLLESQVGSNPRIRVQSDTAFVLWDDIPFTPDSPDSAEPSPEWVRRTVCCARWEATQAAAAGRRAVLAVLSPAARLPGAPAAAEGGPSVASPVPLPAPPAANKHEPRAAGTLVRTWAARARVPVLDVRATPEHPEDAARGEERGGPPRRRVSGPEAVGRRVPSSSQPLVERPPAVQAMMQAVAQPTRVVRVLARGETLDP